MSWKTEFRVAVAIAIALVLLRSAVQLVNERSLDSDQAIVGLMAKHASEFRTFPLFFYGQNYMLGVQAWLAAPFYWIGGPTAPMLRLPLLLLNAGLVWGVIAIFRGLGCRPALALVATLPLAITTPVMSDALLRPLGAAVGPFVWILALWVLRRRPLLWGAVLCFGTLHREFVVYAVPAMVLAQWREGRRWSVRDIGLAVSGSAVVWVVIDLFKRSINLYGPPGGEFAAESLAMQSQQIASWLSLEAYGGRLWHLLVGGLPDMFGGRPYRLEDYHGLFSDLSAGSWLAGAALVAALAVSAARLATGLRARGAQEDGAFFWYLGVVGVLSVLGYGLNGGLDTTAMPVVRYALFVLFLPVAILGAYFSREDRRSVAVVVASLTCFWAGGTAVDAVRVAREYVESPPINQHRELADYLVQHGVRYARAQYWDAYIVTFLAQEQVVVASEGKVRVTAYRAIVDAHADEAVSLVRQPCAGERKVAAWCLE